MRPTGQKVQGTATARSRIQPPPARMRIQIRPNTGLKRTLAEFFYKGVKDFCVPLIYLVHLK